LFGATVSHRTLALLESSDIVSWPEAVKKGPC
jgi:hypothetical protein